MDPQLLSQPPYPTPDSHGVRARDSKDSRKSRDSGVSKPTAIESVPPRRSKVSVACLPCRSKKVKCDGRPPTCSRCAQLCLSGWSGSCSWATYDGRRTSELPIPTEKRLKRSQYGSDLSRQYQGHSSETSPSSLFSEEQRTSVNLTTAEGSRALPPPAPPPQGPAPCTTSPFWYGDLGYSIDQGLSRRGRRFPLGLASVGPLITSIAKSTASPEERRSGDPFPTNGLFHHEKRSPSQISDDLGEASYELPRRAKFEASLAAYWDRVHPVFPVLDMEETKQASLGLWSEESSHIPNRPFLCIINIILARISRLDTTIQPSARDESSSRYYGRALDLFNHRRPYHVSFPSLQAALLIAEYLHSLDPEQCWMFTGIAIRMAQSLGIDRPHVTSSIQNAQAVTLCQRVWKLCITWDRITCMTYGHCLMISQRDASLALRAIGAQPHNASSQPINGRDSTISLFLDKSLELYIVIGYALEDFSAWDLEQHNSVQCSNIDHVLAHERSMTDWESSLPPALCISQTFDLSRDPIQHRHAVMLQQRFFQCRIVLLRPLLSYLIRECRLKSANLTHAGLHSLSHRTVVQCAISCVAAAMGSIDTVSTYNQFIVSPDTMEKQSFTHAWWYNVLFTYNAATVLIAARLCGDVVAGVGESNMEASWSLALDLFRRYEDNGAWVKRLSQAMHGLSNATDNALLSYTTARSEQLLNDRGSTGDVDRVSDQTSDTAMSNTEPQNDFVSSLQQYPLDLCMDFFPFAPDLEAILTTDFNNVQ